MVKVINNTPNFIGLTPVATNPVSPVAPVSNFGDLENYIKLIDKALELFVKFQEIKNQLQNKQNIQQPIQVSNVQVERTINDNLNKELNNAGDNMVIDADYVLMILEQVNSLKDGITVKEVIQMIKENKETFNNLLKVQGVK